MPYKNTDELNQYNKKKNLVKRIEKAMISREYEELEKAKKELDWEEKLDKIEKDGQAMIDSANLVKRLNDERKQRTERLYQKAMRLQSTSRERSNEYLENNKRVRQDVDYDKKLQIIKRIEKMKKESEVRKSSDLKSKRIVKELLQNKSPHENYYERKYFVEKVIPEKERVSRAKQEKKTLFKPVRLAEIAEHAA